MFANAKTLAAPKASKKADKATVAIDGMENLAALDAMIKALTSLKEVFEADVKGQMNVQFIKDGVASGKRPSNFKGVEGDGSASCELRIRTSTSALTEEDAKRLQENGIDTVEAVSVIGTYVINPEYLENADVMGRAEAALVAAGLPADLIMQQEEKKKTVVGPNAIDQLFAKKDAALAQALLPLVSTPAVKPKFDNVSQAYELVKALINPEGEDEALAA